MANDVDFNVPIAAVDIPGRVPLIAADPIAIISMQVANV
jgi:hypothetical protein